MGFLVRADEALEKWVEQPEWRELEKIKKVAGEQRKKILALLEEETETKGVEPNRFFKLYRGISDAFFADVHDRTFKSKHRSSWSTDIKIAENFAQDRLCEGLVLTCWVPESAVLAVPFLYLREKNKWPGIQKEKEVIIAKDEPLDIVNAKRVPVFKGNEVCDVPKGTIKLP